jgi:exonuclease III
VLKGGKGIRFDHLWISCDLKATPQKQLLDEAEAVGSDHALDLRRAGGTSAG